MPATRSGQVITSNSQNQVDCDDSIWLTQSQTKKGNAGGKKQSSQTKQKKSP